MLNKGFFLVKSCPICDKSFETTSESKIYCSEKCKKRTGPRKPVLASKHCIVCGKIFTPKKTNVQLICSDECRKIRTIALVKASKAARKYKLQNRSKIEAAKVAHRLRMQHQEEAKARGLTYGQYIAWLNAGLLKEGIT